MRHFKTLATVSAALGLVVSMAGPSPAADGNVSGSKPAETRHSSKTSQATIRTITGTVAAVQPDAKTIEVKVTRSRAGSLLVGASLTDQTVITEGKMKKSLTDLKIGDHVWMKFERSSSGDIAKMIVLKPEGKRS